MQVLIFELLEKYYNIHVSLISWPCFRAEYPAFEKDQEKNNARPYNKIQIARLVKI